MTLDAPVVSNDGAPSGTTIGNALVIAVGGETSDHARVLAEDLVADPAHELVVVDLPAHPTSPLWELWERVAEAIPPGRRGLRLIVPEDHGEVTTLAGHWLAERLGRTVVVPDGPVRRGANGCLFVHSRQESGWLTCRPGKPSEREAKRFPRPSWDGRVVSEVLATGSSGITEPVPAGLWLHPAVEDETVARHRERLLREIPCQPDVMTVLVGCPGMAAIPVEDVAYLWNCLPDELRPRVRFAAYGPIAVSGDGQFGQTLAELVHEPVVCYPGVPIGRPERPDIHTLHPDARLGWRTYAREVEYSPDASPRVRSHWLPFEGVTPAGDATYWYTPDAIVEIVPAGLWLRPPDDFGDADAVRARPCNPAGPTVFFDNATERSALRMHWLARDVITRMETDVRARTSLIPASPNGAGSPPGLVSAPRAERWHARPAEPGEHPPAAPRLQTPPVPDAAVVSPADDLTEERQWFRDHFGPEIDAVSASVARSIGERSGRWTLGAATEEDVHTDAVALRLYLSVKGEKIDRALRFGETGPHVPLARCAAAALSRLPVHRGAVMYTIPATADLLRYYREHSVVTDWGFLAALVEPGADRRGDVDVLLWSMTARSTRDLEPEGDESVPGRVLFLPGTRFKILDVGEPRSEEGTRGRVLLRELAEREAEGAGEVSSLDELAATSLRTYGQRWETVPATGTVGVAARERFTALPGLLPR